MQAFIKTKNNNKNTQMLNNNNNCNIQMLNLCLQIYHKHK